MLKNKNICLEHDTISNTKFTKKKMRERKIFQKYVKFKFVIMILKIKTIIIINSLE